MWEFSGQNKQFALVTLRNWFSAICWHLNDKMFISSFPFCLRPSFKFSVPYRGISPVSLNTSQVPPPLSALYSPHHHPLPHSTVNWSSRLTATLILFTDSFHARQNKSSWCVCGYRSRRYFSWMGQHCFFGSQLQNLDLSFWSMSESAAVHFFVFNCCHEQTRKGVFSSPVLQYVLASLSSSLGRLIFSSSQCLAVDCE